MKKTLAALALSGVLLCGLGTPALASPAPLTSPDPQGEPAESVQTLPHSLLYCGELKELIGGEDGAVTGLHLDSAQSGEFVMNLSESTVWIDGENRTAGSPEGLEAGEQLYVFHSPISTRSLPPQSAAFAVVRNVPQGAVCPHYHQVEAAERREDGSVQITTDNGGLLLFADGETPLSAYAGDAPAGLDDIRTGGHIMAWYDVVALSMPGQAHAQHIMVLDREEASAALTRSELALLLHTAQGSPVVNYAMGYSDVDQDAPYAEAVRWASSLGLITGYSDGRMGPDDPLRREQMAVILWRQVGSPMLMDYPGLAAYSDAGEISRFAQPAMAWAHQRGLLSPEDGRLGPKDTVTLAEAEAALLALADQG